MRNRAGVEIGDFEHGFHAALHRDVVVAPREDAGGIALGGAQLVAQHGAGGQRRQRGGPPLRRARAIHSAVGGEGQGGHARGAQAPAGAAFGIIHAVGRVVQPRRFRRRRVADLRPDRDRLVRGDHGRRAELQVRGNLVVLRGVVVMPRHRARLVVEIGTAAGVDHEPRGTDGADVGLGAGRADGIARRVGRGELFRHAPDVFHLFVAQEFVLGAGGRVVAVARRLGHDVHLRIQIDAAVELHEDVFGRTVRARDERQVVGTRDAGQGDGVAVVGVVRIAQAIRVEGGIAVAAVLAHNRHGAGLRSVFVDLDGLDLLGQALAPGQRHFGIAPGERVELAGGHIDQRIIQVAQLAAADLHLESPVVVRVVEQARAVGKDRIDVLRRPVRQVVLGHHEEHRHAVVVEAAAGGFGIVAHPGGEVPGVPAAALVAPGEMAVDVEQARQIGLPPLTQERDFRRFREPVRRAALVVAVGVDDRQAFAFEQDGMRLFAVAAPEVVVVVAHDVVHGLAGTDHGVGGIVHAAEIGADVAFHRVEEIVVGDPHARIDVVHLPRRIAEVFAVEQRVVARLEVVEHGVAVVAPVAETARNVELLLHLPAIAPVGAVLRAVHLAEEVRRHVLHGIQPEAVRAGLVREPADGAEQQAVDVLRDGIAHVVLAVAAAPGCGAVVRPAGIDAGIGERLARLARVVLAVGVRIGPVEAAVAVQILERFLVREREDDGGRAAIDHLDGQVGVEVVFRMAGVADPGPFRVMIALAVAEAGVVVALLRDVLAERIAVQHLPLVGPVRPAVVFVGGFRRALEVEILRHEPVGLQRARRAGRHRAAVVRHDVVEIDAQAEAMRHFDEVEQFGFRPVLGGDGAVLVLGAQVEAVVAIEAHGQSAAGLERRRQPQRRVARFGQFGNPAGQFRPARVEVLEDHFAGRNRARRQNRQPDHARPPPPEDAAHVAPFVRRAILFLRAAGRRRIIDAP